MINSVLNVKSVGILLHSYQKCQQPVCQDDKILTTQMLYSWACQCCLKMDLHVNVAENRNETFSREMVVKRAYGSLAVWETVL